MRPAQPARDRSAIAEIRLKLAIEPSDPAARGTLTMARRLTMFAPIEAARLAQE
jgi:hypothetical protein